MGDIKQTGKPKQERGKDENCTCRAWTFCYRDL